MDLIHSKGQYFTVNITLKRKLYEFILNKSNRVILEPSIGQGDLVAYIKKINPKIKFDMYEIDDNIKLLSGINKNEVKYGDFLLQKINKKYKTIIGNPPYVKTTKGNLYIDFIEKCYNLLSTNGELIFIVPSDVFKLTSSVNILNEMMINGTFTHIYHPNNEKLFINANIDIIIFRYCKNKLLDNKVMYNDINKYLFNTDGIITFKSENLNNLTCINDYFNIYVGMVTGKEDVFKNDKYGNINVLNKKNKIDKYILINEFPTKNFELNNYMDSNKNVLLNRKIRKFNNDNWFEWGALRNIKTISQNMHKDCIYIHNLTRNNEVSFIDKVQYFGGGLILLIPKDNNINLMKMNNYFNSDDFKINYLYSGRFKIGHRQVANCLIDISNFI